MGRLHDNNKTNVNTYLLLLFLACGFVSGFMIRPGKRTPPLLLNDDVSIEALKIFLRSSSHVYKTDKVRADGDKTNKADHQQLKRSLVTKGPNVVAEETNSRHVMRNQWLIKKKRSQPGRTYLKF